MWDIVPHVSYLLQATWTHDRRWIWSGMIARCRSRGLEPTRSSNRARALKPLSVSATWQHEERLSSSTGISLDWDQTANIKLNSSSSWRRMDREISIRADDRDRRLTDRFRASLKHKKQWSNKIYKTELTKIRYKNHVLCTYRIDPQRAGLTLIAELT